MRQWALEMDNDQQILKPDKPLELSMKWEQAFRDLLDEIHFKGYSQQIIVEKPEEYQREYFYFISLYDEPSYK